MDIKMTALVLIVTAALIAAFMEIYKKKIRKDNAGRWEIYGVALALSVATSATGYKAFGFEGTLWAIPLYAFLVFTVQFFVNMEIIKSVVKSYAKRKGIEIDLGG